MPRNPPPSHRKMGKFSTLDEISRDCAFLSLSFLILIVRIGTPVKFRFFFLRLRVASRLFVLWFDSSFANKIDSDSYFNLSSKFF